MLKPYTLADIGHHRPCGSLSHYFHGFAGPVWPPVESAGAAWPGISLGADPLVFHFRSALVQAVPE